MSQYTVGPWDIVPQSLGDQLIAHLYDATGRNMRLIGFVMSRQDSKEEDIANALLIASAPELLAAFQEMLSCYVPERSKDRPRYLAIVAKAKGGDA